MDYGITQRNTHTPLARENENNKKSERKTPPHPGTDPNLTYNFAPNLLLDW